eukprot:COSAG02_NODE_41194_length_397_cov_0.724832_2_plen_66_part_01
MNFSLAEGESAWTTFEVDVIKNDDAAPVSKQPTADDDFDHRPQLDTSLSEGEGVWTCFETDLVRND